MVNEIVERHIRTILIELGIDLQDENFRETPKRIAKMLTNFVWKEEDIQAEVRKILSKTFKSNYSGIVIERDIRAVCLCPHHFLPVLYLSLIHI